MSASRARRRRPPDLAQRLSEAQATIEALLSGQVDAVVDRGSSTLVLLSQAQEALRHSEERYRRIVETANEGIWTIDNASRVTFANRRLAEMLGYSEEEMLGRSLTQFLAGAATATAALATGTTAGGRAPAAAVRAVADPVELAGPAEIEVPVVRKDNSEIWALIRTSPILDSEGRRAGILVMMTDKTRHKQAEDALRRSEAQYRQIVEATSDGLMRIDGAGLIGFANRRLGEMLGYPPRELVGRPARALLADAEERPEAARLWSPTGRAIDTVLRHSDGSRIAASVCVTPMLDGAGRHLADLAVVRDDPEKRKRQSELLVVDRMASVGTLAAGVAHEINNPLAAVLANLKFLSDSLLPGSAGAAERSGPAIEDIKAALDDARAAAERVQHVVREMKLFSRSAKHESLGPLDVNAVLDSAVKMVANEIRQRARLVEDYQSVPSVEANDARLGQVFLHLLVNAAHALPAGAPEDNEVRVSSACERDEVVVEVSDTGPGIPAEIIPRIFDAFFTTKPVGTGTGLGLAVCQRLVTEVGGHLTVHSEPGRGARFRVSLPVARSERITLRMEPPAAPSPPAAR